MFAPSLAQSFPCASAWMHAPPSAASTDRISAWLALATPIWTMTLPLYTLKLVTTIPLASANSVIRRCHATSSGPSSVSNLRVTRGSARFETGGVPAGASSFAVVIVARVVVVALATDASPLVLLGKVVARAAGEEAVAFAALLVALVAGFAAFVVVE